MCQRRCEPFSFGFHPSVGNVLAHGKPILKGFFMSISKIPDGFYPIKGYENHYAISKNAEIIRIKKSKGSFVGKIRKNQIHPTRGYLIIVLCANNVCKTHDIHVLMAKTFLGEYGKGMNVCHNNGIKTDCRLENLRIDTVKSNNYDRVLHGTSNRGERNGHNKYSQQTILEIRKLFNNGICVKDIAKKFNMKNQYISKIIKKEKWAWL